MIKWLGIKDGNFNLEDNLERTKRELSRFISGDLYNVKLDAEPRSGKLEEFIESIEYELCS